MLERKDLSSSADPPGTIDPGRFRAVMGCFATGVTLVTARSAEGRPVGLTVNSVASVSLEPVLIMVCLDRASVTHDHLLRWGRFAVSVLAEEQEELSHRFAAGEREGRFEGLDLRGAATGSPILADALAWLDCRVWKVVPAGDHSVILGEVLDADSRAGSPLIFFRGGYYGMPR